MQAEVQKPRTVIWLERVSFLGVVVAIGMLVIMSALVVLQVTVRNFFDLGLPWANELARFTGIALVYLMVPYLLMRDRFIAVDVLSSRLKGRLRFMSRLLNEIVTLVFAALTLWGFQLFLSQAGTFTTPAMGVPNWLFYLPALIGILLLTLAGAVRVTALVRGRLPEPDSGAQS